MVNITRQREKLREETAWQKTPECLSDSWYERVIIKAIEEMFVHTGRAGLYDTLAYTDEDGDWYLDYDMPIDEERYVQLTAQKYFLQRVQTDVNNIVSYSTDALTVTNADKPYAHLADSIANIENDRRILYYKMVNYTML